MSTEVVRATPAALTTLRELLQKARPRLAAILPAGVSADRMIAVATAHAARTPDLLACTPASVLQAVGLAAQLGLEIGGPLGHAHLIPYRSRSGGWYCQLIIGYRGLLELVRRGGQVRSVEARVVHERDIFAVDYGTGKLSHVPCLDGDPGPLRAVWARAKLASGDSELIEVMSAAQVEGIKTRSPSVRSGKPSPWDTDFDEMSRKTVLRRICKYLPVGLDVARAIAAEDRGEAGEDLVDLIEGGESVAEPEQPGKTYQLDRPSGTETARAALRPVLPADVPQPSPGADSTASESASAPVESSGATSHQSAQAAESAVSHKPTPRRTAHISEGEANDLRVRAQTAGLSYREVLPWYAVRLGISLRSLREIPSDQLALARAAIAAEAIRRARSAAPTQAVADTPADRAGEAQADLRKSAETPAPALPVSPAGDRPTREEVLAILDPIRAAMPSDGARQAWIASVTGRSIDQLHAGWTRADLDKVRSAWAGRG